MAKWLIVECRPSEQKERGDPEQGIQDLAKNRLSDRSDAIVPSHTTLFLRQNAIICHLQKDKVGKHSHSGQGNHPRSTIGLEEANEKEE